MFLHGLSAHHCILISSVEFWRGDMITLPQIFFDCWYSKLYMSICLHGVKPLGCTCMLRGMFNAHLKVHCTIYINFLSLAFFCFLLFFPSSPLVPACLVFILWS